MAERTSREDRSLVPCPTCRRPLDDAAFEQAHLCNKCLALHHPACWTGTCASCGARQDVLVATPEKKKPGRKRKSREPWESVKYLAAIAWVVSFFVANVALTAAWAAGWSLNPFRGMPLIIELLIAPYQISALALIVIMTVDAVLRGIARERGSGWPIVIAALGLCTGGATSFAYYVGWGRKPIGDAPERGT